MGLEQLTPRYQKESTARRVVMIDDQPSYTDALAMAFGFEDRLEVVGQATSSNAGVRIALELQPDLVLCDYRMPGDATGTECAARLREYGFHGQIVILTGHAAPHVLAEAEQISDVSVLSKMLNVDEIIETIAAVPVNERSVSFELPSASEPEPIVTSRPAQAFVIGLLLALVAGAYVFLNGEVAASDTAPVMRTAVGGTVLERPFVVIDGSGGQVRVVIEVDGDVVDAFVPSNLPATVALAVSPASQVQVSVESVGPSGTKSCSIGVAKEILATATAAIGSAAVCTAAPGDL